MPYEEKSFVCVDCDAEYKFTVEEQKIWADKGFTNPPKRCKACREVRKASQTSGNRTGGNHVETGNAYSGGGGGYGGGSRGGYGRGGQGGGGGGGRNFNAGPRQMFPTTCAQCGKQTEVPFKPTGSRPVYCRECFQTQKAGGR